MIFLSSSHLFKRFRCILFKGDINVIEGSVKEVIFKTETHERKTCFGFIKIMWDENYLVIPNKE